MTEPPLSEIDQLTIDMVVAGDMVEHGAKYFPESIVRVVKWAVKQPLQSSFEQGLEGGLPLADLHRAQHLVVKWLIQWAKQPLQVCPEEGPDVCLSAVELHRAQHRVGGQSRIDTDPALNAFVRARIDRMTFAQIEADIAAHFPPGQRASLSGLHRWFHRQKPRAAR